MRTIGTVVRGVRAPIIKAGDDLAQIVVDSILAAQKEEGFKFRDKDVVAITEAVVGKAEGNFVTVDDIARDVENKYPSGEVPSTGSAENICTGALCGSNYCNCVGYLQILSVCWSRGLRRWNLHRRQDRQVLLLTRPVGRSYPEKGICGNAILLNHWNSRQSCPILYSRRLQREQLCKRLEHLPATERH